MNLDKIILAYYCELIVLILKKYSGGRKTSAWKKNFLHMVEEKLPRGRKCST